MLRCPTCRGTLARAPETSEAHWACGSCGGRALTLGGLRRSAPAEFSAKVAAAVVAGGRRGVRRCPLCLMHFVGMRVEHRGSLYALDFCDQCRLVWFDPGEHEAAQGRVPAPPPPDPLHDRPSTVISTAPGRNSGSLVEVEEGFPAGPAGVAGLLGLPLLSGAVTPHRPVVTTGVAAVAAILTAAAAIVGHGTFIREWGLVPATPLRHGGLDFVTSFFLHADFRHLVGNLLFLLVFGPHVEEVLRTRRFALLLFAGAFAGDLLFVVFEWGSRIPSVGASGGISGVLVYFALTFPHARVRTVEWAYFQAFTIEFTALAWVGLWAAFQVVGGVLQWFGEAGVNYLAHLGGAAVGLALWLRRRD